MRSRYLIERRNRKLIDRFLHLTIKERKTSGRAYDMLIYDEFFIGSDRIDQIFKENIKYFNLRTREIKNCPVRIKWRK